MTRDERIQARAELFLGVLESSYATTFHFAGHPRNRKGEFVDVLRKLRDKQEVHVPGGVSVGRRFGVYHVRGSGEMRRSLSSSKAMADVLALLKKRPAKGAHDRRFLHKSSELGF